MRVAISNLTLPLDSAGGLQARMTVLIEGLLRRGVKVNLIQNSWAADRSTATIRGLTRRGLSTTVVPTSSHRVGPSELRRHYQTDLSTLAGRCDLVDTYDPYQIQGGERIPVVYSTNSLGEYAIRHLLQGGMRLNFSLLPIVKAASESRIIHHADGFVVESRKLERTIRRIGGPKKPIVITPVGYDPREIREATAHANGPTPNTITFVGRLIFLKGIFVLLKAFKRFLKTLSDWRLQIIGDGPDRKRLRAQVHKLGLSDRVELLGPCVHEEALERMAASSIVVLPSFIESVPVVLIEAMALQKPIVSTDVGAIGEELIASGVDGLLVRPRSERDLEHGLRRLASQPELATAMGQRASVRVKSLTHDRMVDATLDLYRSVLSN